MLATSAVGHRCLLRLARIRMGSRKQLSKSFLQLEQMPMRLMRQVAAFLQKRVPISIPKLLRYYWMPEQESGFIASFPRGVLAHENRQRRYTRPPNMPINPTCRIGASLRIVMCVEAQCGLQAMFGRRVMGWELCRFDGVFDRCI